MINIILKSRDQVPINILVLLQEVLRNERKYKIGKVGLKDFVHEMLCYLFLMIFAFQFNFFITIALYTMNSKMKLYLQAVEQLL